MLRKNDSWVVATRKVTIIDSNGTTNCDTLPWTTTNRFLALILLHNRLCFIWPWSFGIRGDALSKWKMIKKSTSFTSLRLNCWNITQVVRECKILTNFGRIFTYYLTQSYLLKKINILSLRHWYFPGKYRNFLEEQKQPPEVFCKSNVLKIFAIVTEKHLCWRLFII